MSNSAKKTSPFDLKTVESLVELMAQHDLSEIYLRDGTQHVRLRRGAVPSLGAPVATHAHHTPNLPASPAAESANSNQARPDAAPAGNKNVVEIKSETVGTFYSQPKPGDPPYVKVGDRVKPNTPIGVIVVMKTNNEIVANCSGVIVEVLVQNEQFVDFGQVLFRVDPTA